MWVFVDLQQELCPAEMCRHTWEILLKPVCFLLPLPWLPISLKFILWVHCFDPQVFLEQDDLSLDEFFLVSSKMIFTLDSLHGVSKLCYVGWHN
jgi:hypothetical protein